MSDGNGGFERGSNEPPGRVAENRDANDDFVQHGPESIRAAIRGARDIDLKTGWRRPTIEIRSGELHQMATEAEDALLNGGAPIYIRGGLARPIVDEVAATHGRKTKVARLKPADPAFLVDHLSRCARFEKFNARKKGNVPADPPRDVATTILSRDGEWRFPRLAGIITTPTLRPDGSLLIQPGYDEATELLLASPPPIPRFDESPSRETALRALKLLTDLLVDFPFVDRASRAVALSGMITPVVRGAMLVAPLHATTAPVPGSGKSFIVDLWSAIATGERAPVISAGKTEEETEKRLGAALLAGQPIVSIDNVNGELGGDALCQMIERPVISVRPLGVSQLVKIESRATLFATGNNIHLVGDMTRRVVLVSLDPNTERPELRKFQSNPLEKVIADRGRYIAAALIISRAYLAAGCPGVLPSLASFEDWSRVVRSALVWLGEADPVDTINRARSEDPVVTTLTGLLTSWFAATGSASLTSGGIKDVANGHGELREALLEIANDNRGGICTRRLGKYLGRHTGRIVSGLKLTVSEDSHSKQKLWRVGQTS